MKNPKNLLVVGVVVFLGFYYWTRNSYFSVLLVYVSMIGMLLSLFMIMYAISKIRQNKALTGVETNEIGSISTEHIDNLHLFAIKNGFHYVGVAIFLIIAGTFIPGINFLVLGLFGGDGRATYQPFIIFLVTIFLFGIMLGYVRVFTKRMGVQEITTTNDSFWKRSLKIIFAAVISVVVFFGVIFIATYFFIGHR